MTRIVAGSVGGRSIAVPAKGTRPTSDRVREAIFSRLEHLDVLDGARVLDLYAGSGALGLEAASRGAVSVTLVDSARAAADVARKNVAALGLTGVRVTTESAERYAAALAGRAAGGAAGRAAGGAAGRAAGGAAGPAGAAAARPVPTAASPAPAAAAAAGGLDLVFLDPPYDLAEDDLAVVLTHLATPGVLSDGAVVVVERSTRTPEPAWPHGLAPFARKDYGETAVYYAEPSGTAPEDAEPEDAAPEDSAPKDSAPGDEGPAPSDSVGA